MFTCKSDPEKLPKTLMPAGAEGLLSGAPEGAVSTHEDPAVLHGHLGPDDGHGAQDQRRGRYVRVYGDAQGCGQRQGYWRRAARSGRPPPPTAVPSPPRGGVGSFERVGWRGAAPHRPSASFSREGRGRCLTRLQDEIGRAQGAPNSVALRFRSRRGRRRWCRRRRAGGRCLRGRRRGVRRRCRRSRRRR